jgi:hypothetical protein
MDHPYKQAYIEGTWTLRNIILVDGERRASLWSNQYQKLMTRVLGTGDKWDGRYGTLGNGVGKNAISRALARVMIDAASVHDIFGTGNKGYLEANAVAYITVYIAHDPKEILNQTTIVLPILLCLLSKIKESSPEYLRKQA